MAISAGRTSTGTATELANAQPPLVILAAWGSTASCPGPGRCPTLIVGALGLVLTADPTVSLAARTAAPPAPAAGPCRR